jgi:hypothetical protein
MIFVCLLKPTKKQGVQSLPRFWLIAIGPTPLDDVNGWLVGDVKLGERSLSAVLVAVVLALQLEIDEPDSPGEQGALQEAKRIIRDM